MFQIYKYALLPNFENSLYLTKGSKILHVDVQNDSLQAWILHDLTATDRELRVISVWGTGINIPDHGSLLYLNTCFTKDQSFVWHAFERVSAF